MPCERQLVFPWQASTRPINAVSFSLYRAQIHSHIDHRQICSRTVEVSRTTKAASIEEKMKIPLTQQLKQSIKCEQPLAHSGKSNRQHKRKWRCTMYVCVYSERISKTIKQKSSVKNQKTAGEEEPLVIRSTQTECIANSIQCCLLLLFLLTFYFCFLK